MNTWLSMGRCWNDNDEGSPNNFQRTLSQCHFLHILPNPPGVESGLTLWEVSASARPWSEFDNQFSTVLDLNSTTNFLWPWPEFKDQFSNALLTQFIITIENTWFHRLSWSTHSSTVNCFVFRRTMAKRGPCGWWNRRKFVIVIGQTGWCTEFEEWRKKQSSILADPISVYEYTREE